MTAFATGRKAATSFKLVASEEDLSQFVHGYAIRRGWRICHFRPAMRNDGTWTTPIEGHAGWPDWVMVRGDRMVCAELKSQRGRFRAGQQEWLDALRAVPSVEVYVWRPSDINDIRRILR